MDPSIAIADVPADGGVLVLEEARRQAIAAESFPRWLVHQIVRWACRRAINLQVDLRVEGGENLPASGPVVIAARHFHHQLDGMILMAVTPRFTYCLVALDWVRSHLERRVMEAGCRLLGWPAILRHDGLACHGHNVFRTEERSRYVRRGLRDTVELLRSGQIVVIFPEAYPNVDSVFTPKQNEDVFLPFRPGLLRLVEWAQRDRCPRVPIVPAGFEYRRGDRWQVSLRFGEPIYLDGVASRPELLQEIENQVKVLSGVQIRDIWPGPGRAP